MREWMSHIKHMINFPRTKERHEFSDRRGCQLEESLVQPVWQTLLKHNLHHYGGAFTPGDMWQRNRNDIRQRCVHGYSQQLYWQEPSPADNPSLQSRENRQTSQGQFIRWKVWRDQTTAWKLTPMCVSSEILHFLYFFFFVLFILFSILFTYYFLVALVFVAAQSILKSQRAGATLHCSVQASHCSGNSCCRTQALSMDSVILAHGQVHCGTAASLLWGMWNLPRPGIEPVSLALAGGFLSTVPPGESRFSVFLMLWHLGVLLTLKRPPSRAGQFLEMVKA